MEKEHFRAVSFHGNLEPDSLRNQDLGMMEQRFILTAQAGKERTPQKNGKKVRNVVVVMGDPSLRDAVKPDAVFDSDDFDTIEKLVKALNTLGDYEFDYLNNHRTLVSDLQKMREKTDFVFNLCDEGLKMMRPRNCMSPLFWRCSTSRIRVPIPRRLPTAMTNR
ncbi:MAG: hypothetical protein U5K69_27095 [Balneolaceae bacterium]|nr:hypothetical protein [Balneolaceae bacterium]